MQLPKVLIFGQPFNNLHGGGITLSNLFRGWDVDKIAVVATGHVMNGVTTDICSNYFQLGCDEFKWRFPFNLIQRKFSSGPLLLDNNSEKKHKRNKTSLRYVLVNQVFYPVLEWLGLFPSLSKIRMTDQLEAWLNEFNPELIYLQVSTRDTVLFAFELKRYLQVPSVIHIMDDWPSTISKKGILRKYWDKKIDGEFRELLSATNLFLSISDAMSYEYKRRYSKDFIAFHNPIDIEFWTQKSKIDHKHKGTHVKILFSGRIGIGVEKSLLDLGQVIESLNLSDKKVKLYVQSPSNNHIVLDKLRKLKSLVINPVVEYSELPEIYSEADILAITNDFDQESINYLRYSMPTKASEYMISGTPILVYSHSETAVSRFFTSNQCGCCVTERNFDKLKDAIMLLIENEQYRQDISSKAFMIASELFDANSVRSRFQNLLRATSLIDK